jgi:hypothetical protein
MPIQSATRGCSPAAPTRVTPSQDATPLLPALTGKVVAYGRKPWLGLKLAGWLNNP